jgi:hypothetical protein
MFWIEIIGIILAVVIFKIWGNSYKNWRGVYNNKEFCKEDKIKRPLWCVILLFIIALIPVVNIVILLVTLGLFINWLLEEDLYFYSNSNIFKWLNKDI